jgi:endonuclease/exonuclease/phosphatase family metal-dependent hydrolase
VELFDRLEFPHKVRDENPWQWRPLTIAGSGLGLASRLPILWHEVRPFRTRGAGVDGLARKGMLLARMQWHELELDLITVHLQAAAGSAAARVRAAQLGEIRAAIEEIGSPDRPLLVCGDLNIDGVAANRGGEYSVVRTVLGELEDLGATADLPTMCPRPDLNALAHRYWSDEPVQRLDYFLLRPPLELPLAVRSVERVLDAPLPAHASKPATFASDHFALRVRLES